MIDNSDSIGPSDCGQAMRNHNDRASRHQGFERVFNNGFSTWIKI